MTGSARAFHRSDSGEPHRGRNKAILQQHPEIRRLIGHNPYTVVPILGLLMVQLGLARGAADLLWWAGAALAYVVGSFVAGIVAHLGTVLPSAASV